MKNLKHLFTTLLLLCCTFATAQIYEIDGIFYKITSDTDKTVGVTFKGDSYSSYPNEYIGDIVIPENITFGENAWVSTNTSSNTTSEYTYTFDAKAGDVLNFDWEVNSYQYYNYLTITLDDNQIVYDSGSKRGKYETVFEKDAPHTLYVKFKIGSYTSGTNKGKISNITINGNNPMELNTYYVTSIEANAFNGCRAVSNITLPESITSIGNYAFQDCSALQSINLPTGITSIGDYSFKGCSFLGGDIIIPNSVTKIGSSTFQDCCFLKSITLPNSVTSISTYAFSGCSSLTEFTIPSSVTQISSYAFNGCTSINSLYFESGTTELEIGCKKYDTSGTGGEGMFYDCPLDSVIYFGRDINFDVYGYNYKAPFKFSTEKVIIGNTVTEVKYDLLKGCSYKYLYIEDGTKTLKCGNSSGGAFYYESFEKLYLGRNLSYDYSYPAFKSCNKLTSVTFGKNVTTLGTYMFQGCSGITEIVIPSNITSINYRAFYNCTSLKKVYIEDGTKTLKFTSSTSSSSYDYFLNCPLETVYLGRKISYTTTSAGYSPFYSLSSLKELTLSSNVANIGNYMFYFSSNITEAKSYSFTAPTLSTTSPFSTKPETATLWVPYGSDYSGYEKYFTIKYFSYIAEFFIDGEKFSEAEVNYGEAIELPTAPEKEGYTFQGWEDVPETMPAKDVQIHGSYKVNNYTVTYIVDGEVYNTTSHTYGTAVTPIEAPAKEGYTFSHWKGVPSTMPANDVEVVAVYNRIPTEVTITINEYGCGTFCSEYALDFTAVTGLKAYAAGGYNTSNGIVTVFQVNTTPAGTGLFIKGEPGSYEVPVIKESFDQTVNLLVGTLEKTNVNATSDDNLYANFKFTIKPEDDEPMFYRFADESTLGAGKAYLQIPLSWLPSVQQRTIGIRFGNNGTTDICETIDESQEVVYYDLSGRKVTNPTRGIYIVNGKKVFIK